MVTRSTLVHIDAPSPKAGSFYMFATPSATGASGDARSASSVSSWAESLAEPGFELPSTATPIGVHVPAVRAGDLVYTSGQLPLVRGSIERPGKVGREVSVTDASRAAEICTLNALAAIDALAGLDSVVRVVKVTGFVASADGFAGQPGVVNGASNLLASVFGDAGTQTLGCRYRRTATERPAEVELVVEVA
ncbi:RidA family protein [Streptomyces sp. NPDC056638]|uniref:RidA family protein n=1 Tax=Streptomyces sp. NPDC056638 TaxID=3345887 RepID=UPI00369544B2